MVRETKDMWVKRVCVFVILIVACGEAASVSKTKTTSTSSSTSGPLTTTSSPVLSTARRTNNSAQSSKCVPAYKTPSPAPVCHRLYNHSTSLCNLSIPVDAFIFVNREQQKEYEKRLRTVRIKREFFDSLNLPNPALLRNNQCFQIIQDMYCHYYFPRCDITSSTPRPQAICKEGCELLNYDCKREWIGLMRYFPGVTWSAQDDIGETREEQESLSKNILMKCKGLPRMAGADIPECYIPHKLLQGKTAIEVGNGSSLDCFYGNGYSYRGNVSVTKSGYKCQSWSDQCPHRHFRTPDKYKELKGAGNACRNPGHQAQRGPWCYTTNPNVRWEYCEIKSCKYDKSQHFINSSGHAQNPQSQQIAGKKQSKQSVVSNTKNGKVKGVKQSSKKQGPTQTKSKKQGPVQNYPKSKAVVSNKKNSQVKISPVQKQNKKNPQVKRSPVQKQNNNQMKSITRNQSGKKKMQSKQLRPAGSQMSKPKGPQNQKG